MHHTGEECGQCHTMGGKAEAYLWTTAGTIYSDRAGREVLKGAEIILQDREGNVISMTSNEAGNFWTTTPLASNPYTVVDPSTKLYVLDAQGNLVQPADPADPRTWLYKTWVRKGYSIRPMITIGPAASTSGMRMTCNMHHGVTGSSRGALWVSPPGKTPPASYPSTGLSYLPGHQPHCAHQLLTLSYPRQYDDPRRHQELILTPPPPPSIIAPAWTSRYMGDQRWAALIKRGSTALWTW